MPNTGTTEIHSEAKTEAQVRPPTVQEDLKRLFAYNAKLSDRVNALEVELKRLKGDDSCES